MRIAKLAFTGLGILVISLGVNGCRQEEQNRPLSYNKGVYQGPKDQALTDSDRRQLVNRMRGQGTY
jgi:hypothetical protein